MYECDPVVVTVSQQILKDGDITFNPEPSTNKQKALDAIELPNAIKVFLKFIETFYPATFVFEEFDKQVLFFQGSDHAYYD